MTLMRNLIMRKAMIVQAESIVMSADVLKTPPFSEEPDDPGNHTQDTGSDNREQYLQLNGQTGGIALRPAGRILIRHGNPPVVKSVEARRPTAPMPWCGSCAPLC
jgi:hypothetical protein